VVLLQALTCAAGAFTIDTLKGICTAVVESLLWQHVVTVTCHDGHVAGGQKALLAIY
jgi:hypothetical protein